jgi:hypothetical protein
MYFVYAHYKSDDQNGLPFYIGKGKNKRDLSTYRNRFWKNIANKHGYIVKRVKDNLTEEQAWDLEKELIKSYGKLIDGTGCLSNISDGGEGASGTIHSQETKNKWSEIKKGRSLSIEHKLAISNGLKGRKHSAETKKKLSDLKQGKKNPMFGKTFTQEHKNKLSKNMIGKPGRTKGKKLSEKARQNMSKAAIIRAKDTSISQKISIKLKGIKRSEETRKKMAEAAKLREAKKKLSIINY